jgi:hypothetical protein
MRGCNGATVAKTFCGTIATIPAAAPAVRKVLRVSVKFVLQLTESYYDPPVGSMNSGSRRRVRRTLGSSRRIIRNKD